MTTNAESTSLSVLSALLLPVSRLTFSLSVLLAIVLERWIRDLPIYLSVDLSIYLSVYVSVYLSVPACVCVLVMTSIPL